MDCESAINRMTYVLLMAINETYGQWFERGESICCFGVCFEVHLRSMFLCPTYEY